MKKNPLKKLSALGQSLWLDNIRRGLIMNGAFSRLISRCGVSGVTSNPSIFEKAVSSGDYDQAIKRLSGKDTGIEELFETLAVEDIQRAADVFREVYDRTKGRDGYVSLEVSPALAYDSKATVKEALRLFKRVGRPNVMIKVPATREGVKAIRELLAKGININATLLFSVERYAEVAGAYVSALRQRSKEGLPVDRPASVASFFVSRVDTSADKKLEALAEKAKDEKTRKKILSLKGKAAVSNCKLAYRRYLEVFSSKEFKTLAKAGAATQRLLWASTSTKNPDYPDTIYVDELAGKDTVNTVPESTLEAFLDHGAPKAGVRLGAEAAKKHIGALEKAGVRLKKEMSALEKDGVAKFAQAYESLLRHLAAKRERMLSCDAFRHELTADYPETAVKKCSAELESKQFARRLWKKDPSLWKSDRDHAGIISNSLGWLDVAGKMKEKLEELDAFASEIKKEGFRHAVVLGMGGSSLAPEVIRRVFGAKAGLPGLLVLDSTYPGCISAIDRATGGEKTLYIVSSKSGGTIEPNCFFRYFFDRVKNSGEKRPGGCFAAITDPGTRMEALAKEKNFRKIFLNPPDIGGRFSALSFFGLVPAAVSGVDVKILLERAERMTSSCGPEIPLRNNPGAGLGCAMAAMAREGRDKLTLVMPRRLEPFGLWIEQLVAESTGKEGKGIVPIAGEELSRPELYGKDRFFVHTGLEAFPDEETSSRLRALEAAGHPVLEIAMKDWYDLGAEFFRWETATAAAGALMEIDPFDQPNVQESKTRTAELLKEAGRNGRIKEPGVMVRTPSLDAFHSAALVKKLPAGIPNPDSLLADFASSLEPGDYAGILAYLPMEEETEKSLRELRLALRETTGAATLFGYGPRYLHSTGQLHKGGPDNGVFLMITADPEADLPVPGENFSFRQLEMAQALGDYQALESAGRRVMRVHLKKPAKESLKLLAEMRTTAG